ncbi:MAG: zinc-ribbon domain-containing protein [Fuerstiella sp.]
MSNSDDNLLASVFEERAEYLSATELAEWTVELPQDSRILAKLKGPGAKLLSGPRGSGKSSYLRRAYFEMLDENKTLPAYVNFSRSLALEPIFHTRTDAAAIFRQWVIAKILVGLTIAIEEYGELSTELKRVHDVALELIHALERGDSPPDDQKKWAPSQLLAFITSTADDYGFRRTNLLLDDAAHAFSAEQQREFFEVFRELRSRSVACKAAVYPGITSYSPNFHVGHEAELVDVWLDPDSDHYCELMHHIVSQRLPSDLSSVLLQSPILIDYLAYAASGLPRSFLVMVSSVLHVDSTAVSTVKRKDADAAVSANSQSVVQLFTSLSKKLPRYGHFVVVGQELIGRMAELLRTFNQNRSVRKKAVVVAISSPLDQELERILGLLEYAGIVRDLGTVSRGVKGVFQRYRLHYSVVVDDNCLNLGQSRSLEKMVEALSSRDAHAFARSRGTTLLGEDYRSRCVLDLAPCPSCGAARVSDDARFCMKCGTELLDTSVYEQLLRTDISELPLTQKRVQSIKKESSIQSVQDILVDEESTQIRGVAKIGPVWAARIRTLAEEYVSV